MPFVIWELAKDRLAAWTNTKIDENAGVVMKAITQALDYLASAPLTWTILFAVVVMLVLFVHSYYVECKGNRAKLVESSISKNENIQFGKPENSYPIPKSIRKGFSLLARFGGDSKHQGQWVVPLTNFGDKNISVEVLVVDIEPAPNNLTELLPLGMKFRNSDDRIVELGLNDKVFVLLFDWELDLKTNTPTNILLSHVHVGTILRMLPQQAVIKLEARHGAKTVAAKNLIARIDERGFFDVFENETLIMAENPATFQAESIKLSEPEEQWLRGKTDTLPRPRSLTSSVIEKMSGKQRLIFLPGDVEIAIKLDNSGKPFCRIIKDTAGEMHTFYFSIKNVSIGQAIDVHVDITAMTPVPRHFEGRFPIPLLFMNKDTTERSITLNAGSSEPVSVVSYFLDGITPTLFTIETPLTDLSNGFFEEISPSGQVDHVTEYELDVAVTEGERGLTKDSRRFKIWIKDEGNSPGQFGMDAVPTQTVHQTKVAKVTNFGWLEIVDELIQEAVQLKHRAGQPQWYHYHYQEWRNDYYAWLKNLLSVVYEQYGPEKRDFVKGYIADKPKPPKWPVGDIQNFITEDAWKLEGELEWLRGERENLKTQR